MQPLFLLSMISYGLANPLDAHLKEIEIKYKDVQGISATFVQETSNDLIPKPVVQEGVLNISRPSALHWKVEKPMEQHFYADAQSITVWTPSSNQAIITANQQSDDISALLTDIGGLRDKYVIQLVEMPETSDMVQFSLAAKEQTAGMDGELKLWFSTVDYTLKEILVDSPNAKTKLTFNALTLNPKFEETEFVFTAPEGADVQDTRQ
jgi:outer membrane lipoprotein-sorting protein